MDKKILAGVFTLSGAVIGAGILGLPFSFSKSGYLVGSFWLIFFGAIILYTNLCLGEVVLRTKGNHQLAGYAKKYLGDGGRNLMLFAFIFGIYSALLAYLIGEGESLSKLFGGGIDSIILGFLFWIVMTFLLRNGLEGLKKVETYGVVGIIIIICIIFFWFMPQIDILNLATINFDKLTFPVGIIIFALLGFTSIPEIGRELKGSEKRVKKVILYGSLIPIILYFIFTATFVGVLGGDVTEIATVSFGSGIVILGIFTMFTSYFVLSFSLKNTFTYDLGMNQKSAFFFSSVIPLVIYLLVSFFGLLSFTLVLGIGGVISGGVTGILILVMNRKVKSETKDLRKPEYIIPISWLVVILLSVIFTLGIVFEFLR